MAEFGQAAVVCEEVDGVISDPVNVDDVRQVAIRQMPEVTSRNVSKHQTAFGRIVDIFAGQKRKLLAVGAPGDLGQLSGVFDFLYDLTGGGIDHTAFGGTIRNNDLYGNVGGDLYDAGGSTAAS